MLVSIVIPFYNSERYFERCVRSLFEQSYKDIEYIFVNDCSTDGSLSILKRLIEEYPQHKSKCQILEHDSWCGSAMARKSGMEVANGDYIIQVDSDDYVTVDYIEKLLSAAEQTGADIVMCNYSVILPDSNSAHKQIEVCDIESLLCRIITGEEHNGLWNKLIRTSIIKENEIYPIPGVNMFDDKCVVVRAAYFAKSVAYVPDVCYYYNRTNPNSITTLHHKSVKMEPALSFIAMLTSFFEEHQVSKKVHDAFGHFLLSVYGFSLLYGTPTQIDELRKRCAGLSFHAVMGQPILRIYYKLLILCDRIHLRFLVRLLRYAVRRLK